MLSRVALSSIAFLVEVEVFVLAASGELLRKIGVMPYLGLTQSFSFLVRN